MEDYLRELQLKELDILKQVLAIIERHNLTYYMLGGTLLGAVRHGGMIPWDDDIDIGMPRPDYERFLELARRELLPPYQLHAIDCNPGEYCYYYARVENTSVMILRKAAIREVIIPVWVDVFPLDGVPKGEYSKKIWIKRCTLLLKLFKASQYSYFGNNASRKVNGAWYKRILRKAFIVLQMEKRLDTLKAWKRLDHALKENRYDDCDMVINFCGFWALREMFPKKWYGKGKQYPFEGMLLNGPEEYDAVLTQMYGDYMTPPPEDKKEHHYIELLTN